MSSWLSTEVDGEREMDKLFYDTIDSAWGMLSPTSSSTETVQGRRLHAYAEHRGLCGCVGGAGVQAKLQDR